MIKIQSARAKGKALEDYISQEIRRKGLDRMAMRQIGSGSAIWKGDINTKMKVLGRPAVFEAKNQKNIQWWQSIDQAKKQAEMGNFNPDKWALVVRDPRTPEDRPSVYALIDFWQFLELQKRAKEPKIKEPDRELKYLLTRLKETCNKVIKNL